jgi:hypothetical protein
MPVCRGIIFETTAQGIMRHAKLQSLLSAQSVEKKAAMRLAARQIIDCYTSLSVHGSHLLGDFLGNELPRQWRHYPEDDIIDRSLGYQYFYHSHSPEDREAAEEHGHFHLFARMDDGLHFIDESAERHFLRRVGDEAAIANTASLLCISLDSRGVPASLFTTNRWVTGDHLFSAASTLQLISGFRIEAAGPLLVNHWIAAMVQLFWPQIEELLLKRDRTLARQARLRGRTGLLGDVKLEVLSSIPIDIDAQIALLED